MTVIAWDGMTLAGDKRGCLGAHTYTVTKVYRVGDSIAGFAGTFAMVGQFRQWLEDGAIPKDYPENKAEDGCYFIVIRPGGRIERYESTGFPIVVEDNQFACGSGRDYARAAMHLGLDAKAAVEVACKFDEGCGNGVDTLTLDAGR